MSRSLPMPPGVKDRESKRNVRAVLAGCAQGALHVGNSGRWAVEIGKGVRGAVVGGGRASREAITAARLIACLVVPAIAAMVPMSARAQASLQSQQSVAAPMIGSAPVSDLSVPVVVTQQSAADTAAASAKTAVHRPAPRARTRTVSEAQSASRTRGGTVAASTVTDAGVTADRTVPAQAAGPVPFAMVVSEQRILPASGLTRVGIGDPTVADVQPIAGGVLVVAKKPGVTTLSIWERGRTEPRALLVNVRALAADALLSSTGATVQVYGDTAVLSGQMANAADHQAALAVAQQSGAKVLDRSTVGTGGVVQVDVKVVEFSKSVLKEAGFNLFSSRSNGFGFGVFGPSQLSTYSPSSTGVSFGSSVGTNLASAFNLVAGPFANGLFGNISIMETNGLARVLAEPTLVALSGQSASFLAGGELPVPQSGGLGTTTITYKQFGIGLTVTPTVLGPGQIALKVAPEASDLDYTHAISESGISIPAITTRRADTTVQLGDGESFVIGGLVSRSTVASVNKVPLLGDLPVIGTFFKNLSYTQDDRELVILVTPHLVKPIARGVALPLPGAGRDTSTQPVWGSFLGGPASGNDVPGFSR